MSLCKEALTEILRDIHVVSRPSITKADFGNLSHMIMLCEDQGFVLMLFQKGLKSVDVGINVNIMITLITFSQSR